MKVKQANVEPYPVEYIHYKKFDQKVFDEFFGEGRWFLDGHELNIVDTNDMVVTATIGEYVIWDEYWMQYIVIDKDTFDEKYLKG